jgi:protein-disulfide isomerase
MRTRPYLRSALALGAAGLLAAACDQMPPGPDRPGAPAGAKPAPAAQPLVVRPAAPAADPAPAGAAAKAGAGLPEAAELFKVPLGESPGRGGRAPKVTVVAFSEFQCPFCAKVLPTLEELIKTYGDDLRIVFKHRPLPFHDRALPAALAAEAAQEQDRFWAMHDQLFENQKALDAASLEKYAAAIGLNVPRWKAAMDSARVKGRVEADVKLADQLAINGTPSFMINGRPLVGAQPIGKFKALVDEELARADQKLAAGISRSALYDELTRAGLEKGDRKVAVGPKQIAPGMPDCQGGAPGACPGAGGREPEVDQKVHKVELGQAPVRGPRDAAITVVLFSDMECPFCKRVEPTLAALEKEYPGKVRVAWKNFPLDMHERARPAAYAAHAAGLQGKFWQMHDKILDNQGALQPADLEKYAQELGLDVARWKAALSSAEIVQLVEADLKQGQALGVSGTPSLFINGRKVVGAQPLTSLKPIVDQELGKKR